MPAEETIPEDARLVLIAANPRSGARSSAEVVEQLAAALERERLAARVITDLDELTSAASEAQREGRLRAIVAAGGDGTLAELVNRTSADTPLAVFPLGTANLMANYCGLEPEPGPFAAMLAAGKSLRLDAARAWTTPDVEPDGQIAAPSGQIATPIAAAQPPANQTGRPTATPAAPSGRIFLIMAGIGFDAAVVARLHGERSGHIRMWNYVKPIWDCVRSYSYPRLRCECACSEGPEAALPRDATAARAAVDTGAAAADSRRNGPPPVEIAFDASWLFVQNLPCYAGGLQFAPRAIAGDGLLDVCALEYGSFWHGLRYLGYVLAGRHQALADCRMLRVNKIRVTSEAPVPVQLDGDPAGRQPLEIESLPGRLRFIGPAAAVARLAADGRSELSRTA